MVDARGHASGVHRQADPERAGGQRADERGGPGDAVRPQPGRDVAAGELRRCATRRRPVRSAGWPARRAGPGGADGVTAGSADADGWGCGGALAGAGSSPPTAADTPATRHPSASRPARPRWTSRRRRAAAGSCRSRASAGEVSTSGEGVRGSRSTPTWPQPPSVGADRTGRRRAGTTDPGHPAQQVDPCRVLVVVGRGHHGAHVPAAREVAVGPGPGRVEDVDEVPERVRRPRRRRTAGPSCVRWPAQRASPSTATPARRNTTGSISTA